VDTAPIRAKITPTRTSNKDTSWLIPVMNDEYMASQMYGSGKKTTHKIAAIQEK
jgi:hypothetical protein